MIDISQWIKSLGVTGFEELTANNQYEFFKGVQWTDGSVTNSQYEFFKKVGESRYEHFKQFGSETQFYKDIAVPVIKDYYTFYKYARQYIEFYAYLLDNYSGAAAAYSLTKLSSNYTGSAVEVRRDSDNAVLDIGFVNNELDTVALENFCSQEVDTYVSDFSTSEDLIEVNGNPSFGETIAGVSDAYKFELDNGSGLHMAIYPTGTINANSTFDITFDYYIPSTNSAVDGLQLRTNNIGDGAFDQNVLDSWQTVTINNFTVTGSVLRIYALDGGNYTFSSDGDVFYLKNMVVTQTSASNGYVTKWYDQSSNGYDAINNIASEQPKIFDSVNGVVEMNGKPAIYFDGVSDSLLFNPLVLSPPYTMITNVKYNVANTFSYTLSLQALSLIGTDGTPDFRLFAGNALLNGSANTYNNLLFGVVNSSNSLFSVNGNAVTGNAGTNATQGISIAKRYGSAAGFFDGYMNEVIVYPTNQSSNRLPIENNINQRYNIYWNGATQRLLDTYSGAAAAYSLEAINANYTGNIIQVRRDSDNTVLNIDAKYDGSLDTNKLENFCNTPVNIYTSDFSVSEQFNEINGTGTINESIGGVSDAYKFELTGGSNVHQARLIQLQENTNITVSFDYYIPSTNTTVNRILFYNGSGGNVFSQDLTVVNSWTSVSFTFDVNQSVLRFFADSAGGTTIDADGDVFYLKNLTITQNTSNGFVAKWYDQSGNSIDAINNIASEQPKIFDGITGVITEYGKPAISFNGTTQWLDTGYTTSQFSQMFCVNNVISDTVVSFSGAVQLLFDRYNTLNDDVVFSADDGLFTVDNINVKGYRNSIDETGSATVFTQTFNRLYIGSLNGTSGFAQGTITELIIYPFANDVSSDRAAIENNINDRYSIY